MYKYEPATATLESVRDKLYLLSELCGSTISIDGASLNAMSNILVEQVNEIDDIIRGEQQ